MIAQLEMFYKHHYIGTKKAVVLQSTRQSRDCGLYSAESNLRKIELTDFPVSYL